jgi:hypothetical protein
MTDELIFTSAGILALTEDEQQVLSRLLEGHDRGAFYMANNAMTDISEASLQSRISTFLKISVTVHSIVSADWQPHFLNTSPYSRYFALNK